MNTPLNPALLTSAELAACADEYIRRHVAEAYNQLPKVTSVYVNLGCYTWSHSKDEYEIKHSLHITTPTTGEVKLEGGSLSNNMDRFRALHAVPAVLPTLITPALMAPPPSTVQDADFTDVFPEAKSATPEDDVPI